jgi:presenilin-like A22 family membrane protease
VSKSKNKQLTTPGKKRLKGIFLLEALGVVVWLATIWLSALPNPLYDLLQSQAVRAEDENGVLQIAAGVVIAVIALVFMKRFDFFGTFVSGLLGFMIFSGLALFINPFVSAGFAILLVIFERKEHTYTSNNTLLLIAILFGAVPLGATYGIELLIWIVVGLSIYDIFGVFVTRFIPNLAKQAAERNVPLLLIAPGSDDAWRDEPKLKNTAALLGAGDVFMPAIFISSVTINLGTQTALWVTLGAIIGILGNTLLAKKIKTGIPAMPMLALGMLVAYAIVT